MKTDDLTPLWHEGWYRHARHLPSPNHGQRPAGVAAELIVVHSISLPPGDYGGPQVQQLFTNSLDCSAHPYFEQLRGVQVSAHFYVRRQGELWQFVSCDDRAWHAGASRYQDRVDCNNWSIGIELEGLEDTPFDDPQYETLASICSAIEQRYPVQHIAGHQHIAPGRKADPGSGFDWQRLQGELAWPPKYFPG